MTVCQSSTRSAQPIAWVDICKGLGIYLVVLGHANVNVNLHRWIYLFHMPLFFFLSGYLHTAKSDLPAYCKKKAIHLLVPYTSFLLLLYPLELGRLAYHHRSGHGLGTMLGHSIFAGIWGGNDLQGIYGVFWFLPCLFLTQQLMNVLLVRCRMGVTGALVLLALLLSYANAWLAPQFSLPLDAQVVLAAMPFFFLGFLGKSIKPDRMFFAVCGAGAVAGAYLVRLAVPVSYNMRDGAYGIPGLSLLIATCCIGCLVAVSMLCTRVSLLKSVLTSLGAASMGIMFIHKQIPVVPAIDHWAFAHGYISSVLFLAVSFAITRLLQHGMLTRALLLGSEADFRKLFRIQHSDSRLSAGQDAYGKDAFGNLSRAS